MLLYKLIKALEYETAQDDDDDEQPILPKSTRKGGDNSSTIAFSTVNVGFEAPAQPPAQGSLQHLAPPTYANTPFVHDKESEKSGGLPSCTGD